MLREFYGTADANTLNDILNAVEESGDPAVFTSQAYVGDLEALARETSARGLRLAGFPRGGITVLPSIPLAEDELHFVCEAYCCAATPPARAAIRQSLYLREYRPSPFRQRAGQQLYHPADIVIKVAELCSRVLAASPQELAVMLERTPYLHITQIRNLCDAIRLSVAAGPGNALVGNAAAPPMMAAQLEAFREQVSQELDCVRQANATLLLQECQVPGNGVAGGPIEPRDIFREEAVEQVAESDKEPEDLTGQEKVDHVRNVAIPEYLKEDDFELVTTEAAFYDGEEGSRRLAVVYVPRALDLHKCSAAAQALEPAATKKNLRALTNGGKPPDTGIVGYYDYLNNPTQRKCRETSYMRSHFSEVMQGCGPLLRELDNLYLRRAPDHYNLQRIAIPTQFQLFGTVFSTITVNRNFRTAVHTDSGDFCGGLGVLCVVDGKFQGCHLAIKKLKKAFRLNVGDVLFFDTSLEHGNTEVLQPDLDWKRISLVCYLRNGLMSAVCELERRKHLNRLIVRSLESAVGQNSAININSVDETLPPLYVPVRLANKLAGAQMSALTFVSERAKKESGCVLAMTMGLGKTLVALTLCYSQLFQHPEEDVLIVVPKPIIPHWVSEYEKWRSQGLHFNYLVASADVNSRGFTEGLLNYEQQTKSYASRMGHVFLLNPEYISNFLRRFRTFSPGLIIADEGHKVVSKGSKLTAALSRLHCKLRIVLSGTPLQNNAEELYRLVSWVNEKVVNVVPPRLFSEFAADINRYIKGDNSAFPDAVLAQRYIQDWMKGFVFREMESDLPPLYDYLLLCGSSSTQRRLEARLAGTARTGNAHYHTGANEHRGYHLSTHPLCYWAFVTGGYHSILRSGGGGGGVLTGEGATHREQLSEADLEEIERYYALVHRSKLDEFINMSGKLTALVRIVNQVKSLGEKIIIFSQYNGTQDLIHRTLTAFGITAFTVRGRDTQDRRRYAMEQFEKDATLTALILSTKIAAFGLDFTAANHVALFDSWWNPQVDAQAVARAYRRNQTKAVTVYRLASEAEDQSVLAVQTRKMALFNCIMHERTSRSALPDEVQDCTETEKDATRQWLWHVLKAELLEGGCPAVKRVYLYNESVKEAEQNATEPPPLTAVTDTNGNEEEAQRAASGLAGGVNAVRLASVKREASVNEEQSQQ